MTEIERFVLVFAKTGSINSGTCLFIDCKGSGQSIILQISPLAVLQIGIRFWSRFNWFRGIRIRIRAVQYCLSKKERNFTFAEPERRLWGAWRGPKLDIFGSRVLKLIRPVWVGDIYKTVCWVHDKCTQKNHLRYTASTNFRRERYCPAKKEGGLEGYQSIR